MGRTAAGVTKAKAALQELCEALTLDGFDSEVRESDGRLVLEVTAGPKACIDCLIPKDVFFEVVSNLLVHARALSEGATVEVIYPHVGKTPYFKCKE